MSGSPQNAMRALSQPMREDSPPAWTTRKIGTSYGSHTAKHLHRHARNPVHDANYSRRNNGATKNSFKTKQRLCGTQQDREHKSAGGDVAGTYVESNTSRRFARLATVLRTAEPTGAHPFPSAAVFYQTDRPHPKMTNQKLRWNSSWFGVRCRNQELFHRN